MPNVVPVIHIGESLFYNGDFYGGLGSVDDCVGQYAAILEVRDYELDSQGIVNHACFVHYLEVARNQYARALGIDFVEWHREGYDLVVVNLQIHYMRPLYAQDCMTVTAQLSNLQNDRMIFEQSITKAPRNKQVAQAELVVACCDRKRKRICMPDKLRCLLERAISQRSDQQ